MKMTARSIRDALLPVFPNANLCDDFLFLAFSESLSTQINLYFPETEMYADNPENNFEYDIDTISFSNLCDFLPDVNLNFLLSALVTYAEPKEKK